MNAVKIVAIALMMVGAQQTYGASPIRDSDSSTRYQGPTPIVRRNILDAPRQTVDTDGSRRAQLEFTGLESGHIAFKVQSTAVGHALRLRVLRHLCASEQILAMACCRVPLCSKNGEAP